MILPLCPFCGSADVAKGRRDDEVWEWEFKCNVCEYEWEAQ